MDLKRTFIALFFAATITTGCSINSPESSNAEFCSNGGLSTEYTCVQEKQSPDRKIIDAKALSSTDEVWMQGKLAEIKTWLQQEQMAPDERTSIPARPSVAASQGIAVRNPSSTDPELMRIEAMSEQGKHRAAMSAVNSFQSTHPDSLEGILTKSLVLNTMGQFDEAEALLKNAIVRHPSSPEVYNNLAVLYAEQGNYGLAIETLLKAFSTHPTYAQVHQNLRELYATVAAQAYSRTLNLNEKKSDNQLVMLRRTANNNAPQLNYQAASLATTEASQLINEAVNHVNNWASNWSAQNVEGYLNAYISGYQPLNSQSNKAWQAQRHQDLTKPSFIKVKLTNIKTSNINTETAQVRFDQALQSNILNSVSKKQLILQRVNNEWRIKEEHSL
ncbi:tetratricopeptide repeat protein [Neptunomonas antarctica]|uniref:Flp pilus assembly protein TadD, contains TPR repeats n=1 Tax=Neptunomonas antarctica TaxID=619304 RepID=A0A1N7MYY7_9GAMM|nr:tetratricopeptide repeat protein [Neptunomonas antarctica]SIS91292.1 Flp pilus assembly protein TadD, contains TPR repeats [Neptunomonas antarctica]